MGLLAVYDWEISWSCSFFFYECIYLQNIFLHCRSLWTDFINPHSKFGTTFKTLSEKETNLLHNVKQYHDKMVLACEERPYWTNPFFRSVAFETLVTSDGYFDVLTKNVINITEPQW